MNHTIKSRKFNTVYSFYMHDSGGYIRMESEGACGTLGEQITYTGGATVRATPETFKKECKNWYRRHLNFIKSEYNL